jgi:hypothetical protein
MKKFLGFDIKQLEDTGKAILTVLDIIFGIILFSGGWK